jgi:hypothetical protein
MLLTKKLNLGEYLITVAYDKEVGYLLITVLDEGHEVIDSIEISNDDDENNLDL